jgi:hypothetical protein
MVRIPLLGRALAALERRTCDGLFKRFAGFVILVLKKGSEFGVQGSG